MAWYTGFVDNVKRLGALWSAQKHAPRSTDRGLFDPFMPIGSLKPIANEYQADHELPSSDAALEESVPEKRHFWLFKAVVTLTVVGLAGRLLILQIARGQEFTLRAKGNSVREQSVTAPRGLIFDRSGVPLVSNIPSFAVNFRPSDLPKEVDQRSALFERLGSALGADPAQLADQITKAKKKGTAVVTLAEGLNREQALQLELRLISVTGVEVAKAPNRQYAMLANLGHLLGYVGKIDAEEVKKRPDLLPTTLTGKSGLERIYDQYLQGVPGRVNVEVDSRGRAIRQVSDQPALVGNSLLTTLDSNVQAIAAQALQDSITKNQAHSGAAVAIDVRTGGILGMVSFPTYDNNLFNQSNKEALQAVLTDPGAPLINRAISGQYPSGSTVKPVVASAALDQKMITPATKLDTSEGKITIGQWTFPDWKTHGNTDVRQAIAESNNIFFYALGGGYKNIGGLGADALSRWLERFGFGATTGIDLSGEAKGLVPNPTWKKKVKNEAWYIGDTYNLAIGQGDFLVTPLQLARATAAIANGGTLYTPHLVKTILRPTGEITKDVERELAKQERIADAAALAVVREGMRQTAVSGSARSFAHLGVEVAAKTGTAQFDVSKEKTHSWFTSFAPYQNPEIAVTVIVEGGGEGFSVAAPVAKNIIEQYFHLPLTPIVQAIPGE